MKNLKTIFASLLLLAVTTLFTAKASAQTTVDFKWKSTVPAFAIGTDDSSPLDDVSNWTTGTDNTGGTDFISYFSATYTGTAPSLSDLIIELRARYEDGVNNRNDLNDTETWSKNINGVSVTFTVYIKN